MTTTLEIQNLKCSGCENTISKKLGALPFVSNLKINGHTSSVNFDALPPEDTERVVLKLSELGYPVVNERNSFGKKAKSYLSCAIGRIQK